VRYSDNYAERKRVDSELEYDPQVDDELAPKEKPVRNGLFFAWCVVLSLLGVGSAFAWRAIRGELSYQPPQSTASAVAYVPSTDFQAYQQSTATALQQSSALLQAQQAEVKRLSDQVAQLIDEVSALKSASAEMHASAKPPAKKSAQKPAQALRERSTPLSLNPGKQD
jgi:hypothetical protein